MRSGSARWSSRSKGIWIERLRTAGPMLTQRFVGEPFQGALGSRERGLPTLVRRQLFEDGGRELVLILLGESSCRLECSPQRVGHRSSLPGLRGYQEGQWIG